MSGTGPPQPTVRRPLQERSDHQSQANVNQFTIRIVPYSPPRPSSRDDESVCGTPAASPISGSHGVGLESRSGSGSGWHVGYQEELTLPAQANNEFINAWTGADNSAKAGNPSMTASASPKKATKPDQRLSTESLHYVARPGSALSSSSSLALPLARSGNDGVSSEPLTSQTPLSPVAGTSAFTCSKIISTNASSLISSPIVHNSNQTLSSLSLPSLFPSLSPSPVANQQPPPHFGEERPPSAGSSPILRPVSRRRNFLAINPDSKTFTLVPQRGRNNSTASFYTGSSVCSQPSLAPGSVSRDPAAGITDFGALRSAGSSSPLVSSSFSTLSTLSTPTVTLTLDHPSFDGFSRDHPSSPLKTIPDDKIPSSVSPETPSQKTTAQQYERLEEEQECIPGATQEPLASTIGNYCLGGGIRKVPSTPETKGKGKAVCTLVGETEDSPGSFTTTRSPTVIIDFSPSFSPPLRQYPLPLIESPAGDNSGVDSDNSNDNNKCALPGPHEVIDDTNIAEAISESEPSHTRYLNSFLRTKASFQSTSASTISERTNYKIYGQSSPVHEYYDQILPELPSSSHSNYVVLGESSPAASFNDYLPVASSSDLDSNDNYVLHGGASPSDSIVTINNALQKAIPADSLVTPNSHQDPCSSKFSQDSVIIRPLHVRKKNSFDRIRYYRQRSRESLSSQPSLKSLTNFATREAAGAFLAAPALININLQDRGSSMSKLKSITSGTSTSRLSQEASGAAGPPGSSPLPLSRNVRMESHPHIWSSQLSTVMSASEAGSEGPGSSCPPTALSGSNLRGHSGSDRRSSGFSFFGGASTRSRRISSIDSSAVGGEASASGGYIRSLSRAESLDRPQTSYTRPSRGTVHDQDEHGDGLTDLQDLHNRPSKTGIAGLFHNNSSDRNLHSSASSTTGSFTYASLPAWVRLYYGNGERLRNMPSISSLSESSHGNSPSGSSWRPGSPAANRFPVPAYNPWKRKKEIIQPTVAGPSNQEPPNQHGPSEVRNIDVSVAVPPSADPDSRPIRRRTSSIWSPHLRFDRYASRYSVWNPPSIQWSAESGPLGRRNVQVVLFILGFAIPLSWIIAAFLPLPPDPRAAPQQGMADKGNSSCSLDFTAQIELSRNGASDEKRYRSARWWRTLNRFLAVLGMLIIAAVVALAVVGVRQQWGR